MSNSRRFGSIYRRKYVIYKEYRGNGLQKSILMYLLNICKNTGYKYGITTIHPENSYSIKNIEKVGFVKTGEVALKRGIRAIFVKKI